MDELLCLLSSILRKFRPVTWVALSFTGVTLLVFTAEPLLSGYKYIRKLDLPSPQPLLLQSVYMLTMAVLGALFLVLLGLAMSMLCLCSCPDKIVEYEERIPNSDDPEAGYSLHTTSYKWGTFAGDAGCWLSTSALCFYFLAGFLFCKRPECPSLGLTREERVVALWLLIPAYAVLNTCGLAVAWLVKNDPSACVDEDDKGETEDSLDTVRDPLIVGRTDEDDGSHIADAQV